MSGEIGVAFELLWHAVFGEPFVAHARSKCDMYFCRYDAALHGCLLGSDDTFVQTQIPQHIRCQLCHPPWLHALMADRVHVNVQ
jgi:hypothetical protein